MPPTATKPAGRRCGCSTWGLLALALLPLVSQDQFTALPSPKRYDNRYEEKFLRNIRPHHQPRDHEDMGVAQRMWKWGIQACSPTSVLVVNITLTRSQSHKVSF